ncbi:MAG: hypothetical protein WC830_20595, partial [Burkholderiales bacterium]
MNKLAYVKQRPEWMLHRNKLVRKQKLTRPPLLEAIYFCLRSDREMIPAALPAIRLKKRITQPGTIQFWANVRGTAF